MSKIKVLGLALVAMFAFGVVAASSASAEEPSWGLCEKLTEPTGLYTQAWCDVHSATQEGEFEFKLTHVALLVNSHGTLTLEDTKATGGPSKIECKGIDHGTVGPLALDLLDLVEAKECKKLTGACNQGTVFAKALNLPWHTLLLYVGNEIRDDLTSELANKLPGYTVECGATIFELHVEDECTGDTSTGILAVSGGVDATFDSNSPNANCTIGGAGTGVVRGTDFILSPSGHNLSAK